MYSPLADSSSSSSGSSPSTSSYGDWSPSSSRTNSPVHAASLVDPAMHSSDLLELIDIEISQPVIEYLVSRVSSTVSYSLKRSGVTPSFTRSPSHLKKFTTFVSTVLSRAEVSAADVLVTLVYLTRARAHLTIALEEWALERVFLGALIISSKYTNDSTLRNVHWALCTGVFGKRDIGRIEREFLEVLDWDLAVTAEDVLAHREGLMQVAEGVPRLTVVNADPLPISRASSSSFPSPVVVGCPDLEPSSPHSSIGSLSPPTPISHAIFPDGSDVPMDVDELHQSPILVSLPVPKRTLCPKSTGHGRIHAFLHSLPIPRHHHHNHHHAASVRVAA
ncbi:hypothetical protein FB45DRAFT_794735 [Roridomyces roridus]|uniref:Cyclin N-terminal domain-containing protein n=1 Tax=Roridomyces roridus TaxID=1738132 RepID=A0AAD7BSP5_9AGAR|nr:hypothetical protein FB45DRAFT_794735 [Roridomyces roridus]